MRIVEERQEWSGFVVSNTRNGLLGQDRTTISGSAAGLSILSSPSRLPRTIGKTAMLAEPSPGPGRMEGPQSTLWRLSRIDQTPMER
jgi:hypothetical protein